MGTRDSERSEGSGLGLIDFTLDCLPEVAGWDAQKALDKADDIYDTVLKVFDIAEKMNIPKYEAADRLAEQRLAAAK